MPGDASSTSQVEQLRERLLAMGAEIRTALHEMIGMTELALDTPLTAQQTGYLKAVKASAGTIASALNNLVDLSLIEADRFDMDPIAFSVRDHLGYTLGPLAMRAHELGLELVCHILPDVPDVLVGDPGMLRKLVVNVLDATMKRTRHGVVVLRVEEAERGQGHVLLRCSVTTTETGRVDETPEELATAEPGGITLRVAVVAQLAELLGGRCWIDPAGTCVVTMRFALSHAPLAQPIPADPARVKGVPVLIADGHHTSRRILCEMLTRWQMHPVEAARGDAALSALEQASRNGRPFPLVITEAALPGLDGFTLAQQIRQRLKDTRVLFLTSSGQRGDAARCRRHGISAYLTKPVTQGELFDAITAVLGTPVVAGAPPLVVTRHSLRESRRTLRILLVEDHLLNQMMASRLLEVRGHQVVMVSDVPQACRSVAHEWFDVVLLHLDMDACATEALISALGPSAQPQGTPRKLIAMSAPALRLPQSAKWEKLVDGWLAIPLGHTALVDAVEGTRHSVVEGGGAHPPSTEPYDRADALARLGGDARLLHELVTLFLSDSPAALAGIRGAMQRREARQLTRAVGALYISLQILSAAPASEAAMTLHACAWRDDWIGAQRAALALDEALERLQTLLISQFDISRSPPHEHASH